MSIYQLKKDKKDGIHVLLCMRTPGSWNATRSIIRSLIRDERCSIITVVASGIAKNSFAVEFTSLFTQSMPSSFVEGQLQKSARQHPFHRALLTVNPEGGIEKFIFDQAKESLGIKKLFFLYESWASVGKVLEENPQYAHNLAGVFCNDVLAQKIFLHQLPGYPRQDIYPSGTPVLDSLAVDKANTLRHETRARYAIPEHDFVFLFLGDKSEDYAAFASCKTICEETYMHTLKAAARFAQIYKEKNIVLLVRPHPRDNNLKHYLQKVYIPGNMTLKFAMSEGVLRLTPKVLQKNNWLMEMNEAAYCADVIASIISTENFLAPLRGRHALFLGYERLGGEVLRHTYSNKIIDELTHSPGIHVAKTPDNVLKILQNIMFSKRLLRATNKITNLAHKITNMLLS